MGRSDIAIEDIIPKGYENRIERREIVQRYGISDRLLRLMIAESEVPVVNIGNGYFIPTKKKKDRHIASIYKMQELARIKSIQKKLKKFKEY